MQQPDFYLVMSLTGNGLEGENAEIVEVCAYLIKGLVLDVVRSFRQSYSLLAVPEVRPAPPIYTLYFLTSRLEETDEFHAYVRPTNRNWDQEKFAQQGGRKVVSSQALLLVMWSLRTWC